MEARSGNFWTGFFIGAAVGGAVGIAVAPMPGKEARARIRDAFAGAGSQASQASAGLAGAVGGVTSQSRQYIRDIRDRLALSIQAGREAAHEKRVELETEVVAVTEPKPSV